MLRKKDQKNSEDCHFFSHRMDGGVYLGAGIGPWFFFRWHDIDVYLLHRKYEQLLWINKTIKRHGWLATFDYHTIFT